MYKVYLNNQTLIFDSSIQEDEILFTKAVVDITAQGAGSFDFTVPPCHKCFGLFKRLVDYVDVYRDNELIWSGRVFSITDQKDGQQAISCEGLLSVLADSVYIPDTFDGTLRALVNHILTVHNSQVGGDKAVWLRNFTIENSEVYRAYQDYNTTISRIVDLNNTFGGYFRVLKDYDPSIDGTVDVGIIDIGYVDMGVQSIYLDWLDHFTDPCTQKIELKSNLLEIKKVHDASDLATVILPLGAKDADGNRLTIESVNAGSKMVIADDEYIQEYGYIVKSMVWNDVTVAENLKAKALTYLQACLTPKTEITISAVDLADAGYDIDSFRVGQMITVKAPQIGPEAAQFACLKQKLNLLQPAQNKLQLGEVRVGYVQSQSGNISEQIMMDVVQRIEHSEDIMQQAIDQATAMITGNQGGYVVFHDGDGDTYPDEILIMDTNDIETAVKVWRWNKNGLGYSDHGYAGPYTTAWTIDGHFNADFITAGAINADLITTGALNASLITTGTLTADRIRAGILRAQTGDSYWNLNSGAMQIIGDLTLQNGWVTCKIGSVTAYAMHIVEGEVTPFETTGFRTSYDYLIPDKSYFAIVPGPSQWRNVDGRVTGGRSQVFRWIAHNSSTVGNSGSFDDQYIIDMRDSSYKYIHEMYYDSMHNYRVTRLGKNFEFSSIEFATLSHGLKSGKPFFCFTDSQVAESKPWSGFSYEDEKFYVNGTQVQGSSSSSLRYKKDVEKLTNKELDPHRLLDLPVKQFRYKEGRPLQYKDMQDLLMPGFIAEDVAEIYPSAVIHSDGEIESWDERRIIPGMLSLIQEQNEVIQELKAEIAELKKLMEVVINGTHTTQ